MKKKTIITLSVLWLLWVWSITSVDASFRSFINTRYYTNYSTSYNTNYLSAPLVSQNKSNSQSNILNFQNSINSFWTVLTWIKTVQTKSYNSLDSQFNTSYNSLSSKRTLLLSDLKNQLNLVNTKLLFINTELTTKAISQKAYSSLKMSLLKLRDTISLQITDLWEISQYKTLYDTTRATLTTKVNSFSVHNLRYTNDISFLNTNLNNYITKVNYFNLYPTTTSLNSYSSIGGIIDTKIQDLNIYWLLVNNSEIEITNIEKSLSGIITNLSKYGTLLNNFSTTSIITDLNTVSTNLTTEINNQSAIDNLKLQIYWSQSWVTLAEGKSSVNWVLSKAVINWVLKNSNLTKDATILASDKLLKVNYTLPVSWFLSIDWDTVGSASNQAVVKKVYSNLKSINVSDIWINIKPKTLTNTGFIQNKPLKKIQLFEESYNLNISKETVFQLNLKYKDNLGVSKSYTTVSKIDLANENVVDWSWNLLTSTGTLSLNWVKLKAWSYTVNLKLNITKSSLKDSISVEKNIKKNLVLSILNKSWNSIFSSNIVENLDTLTEITSIELVNLWWIKYNISNNSTISLSPVFNISDKYDMYISKIKLNFLGYASPEYSTIENLEKTNYEWVVTNKIEDKNWKILWYKTTKATVSINNAENSKLITYKTLKDLLWDEQTKKFKKIYKTYVKEENIIVDPQIKALYDKTKDITFDMKLNSIRDVLKVWSKVQKISRLKDSLWNDIITEYRYFNSTDNLDSAKGDTMWRTLVFFRIVEIDKEWDKSRGVDRIKNTFYKIWLDSNYSKVVNVTNTWTLITNTWWLTDISKPSILTVNPVMNYKVFTYYRLYFNKDNFIKWNIKNSIRYTKIYEKDLFKYPVIKYNNTTISWTWSWLVYRDTIRN